MLSSKKMKKVLITVIIAILIFSIISFVATKIIYDSTFKRYDCNVEINNSPTLASTLAIRESVNYTCGKNQLSAYLYRCTSSNAKDTLIVLAPGHNACSENYIWQIHELLELGWSVFAFDPTGHCRSHGDSSIGFSQEIFDLKATLDYIEKQQNFCYNDIVILGHSRGGYAACCSLAFDYNVSAVVSISGINSAMEGVVGSATKYVGPLAYGNYGFLWVYQTMLFDAKTVNLRADKVIAKSNTPVLLIHGQDDTDVPTDKYSIVSHIDTTSTKNVEVVIRSTPDNSGHTNLLFDNDGTANNEVILKINDFLIKNIKE